MKPDFFSISMFPTNTLEELDTLKKFLSIFEEIEKYTPTYWGNDERVKLNYSKEDIIQAVQEKKLSELYLGRDKVNKYELNIDINANPRAFFRLECKSLSTKNYESFLNLSDQLAAILKPSFGITHLFWPVSYPWTNDDERTHIWMDTCALPTPVEYFKNGPLGVGARTYISGLCLEMFGQDFILNSPGKAELLDWGGVHLDIVESPFHTNSEQLLNAWVKMMTYLQPSGCIAEHHFDDDQMGVSFSPGKQWEQKLRH
ncbi:hypothetical protein [Paenibacillus hunanensis]|uniref:DUF3396 domain-containing protein n=1 Tax=Paenibacillus hunanensis TaxID=539262 RepID=A0ABU1J249_9BACL|nr:hypothetical protein [Paenibacillus hunanensis]MCL9660371.1 hypothetical protein [Paenibacillus hunanensis]MDR6245541.1 hypothetical protein [Paenibacillus hunanensis]GGJ09757.1 hypothetical protein GCM10008022_18610 [Paenibacillus hunanensis]